jgi:FAD/FMN-containing dehydrogenase
MPDVRIATITGTSVALSSSVLHRLKSRLRGPLLLGGDSDYDAVRRVWNGMVDKKPAVIIRSAEPADVQIAVTFAREHALLVSVRGGGHNIAGKSVCDGGVMIDLSPMKRIEVDSARRTVRVEGGATLGDLDRATQAVGLATTAGVVTSTGVGGLTLGGGVGRLARKYGLACDNLVAANMVTADGRSVRASANENTDLFWGLRGAGGNFGAVTSFEFRLHAVGPAVYGGAVLHPVSRAKDVLHFFHEFSRSAPDEVRMVAVLLTSAEGQRLVALSACHIGSLSDGERVLQPLKRFGPPLIDQLGPVSYLDLQATGDAFFPVGRRYYWKSHFITDLPSEAIDITLAHFEHVTSPQSLVVIEQYGGAVSRVAPADTAFNHRDAAYDFIIASAWSEVGPADEHIAWVRTVWDATQRFAKGVYVNNLGDESEDQVHAAYGENYQRLAALKRTYDPDNFFRLNQNIKPK